MVATEDTNWCFPIWLSYSPNLIPVLKDKVKAENGVEAEDNFHRMS